MVLISERSWNRFQLIANEISFHIIKLHSQFIKLHFNLWLTNFNHNFSIIVNYLAQILLMVVEWEILPTQLFNPGKGKPRTKCHEWLQIRSLQLINLNT